MTHGGVYETPHEIRGELPEGGGTGAFSEPWEDQTAARGLSGSTAEDTGAPES